MRRAAFLVLALLALIAVPAVFAADDEAPALPKWKKGEQAGTVEIEGHEEGFVALVPKGYSPKRPVPTVLLLHGNGGAAESFLRAVKPRAGKKPPLLISLERCDNNQDAVGYAPKYLAELRKQFAIEDGKVFALGFSGGGFRLWDDVVCNAEALAQFRGVVLVGSAKQSFDPPDKPEAAPTVILVGDPKDPNFTEPGPAAETALTEKGYDVITLEHSSGHSLDAGSLDDVFEWIADVVRDKEPDLETQRVDDDEPKRRR